MVLLYPRTQGRIGFGRVFRRLTAGYSALLKVYLPQGLPRDFSEDFRTSRATVNWMRTQGVLVHQAASSSAEAPRPPMSPRTPWNRRQHRSLFGGGDSDEDVQAGGTLEPGQPLHGVPFARIEPEPSSPSSIATPFHGLGTHSSQSAPWVPPRLKPLPYASLHQWVHEHEDAASLSEVPPTRRVCMRTRSNSVWPQLSDSLLPSPTENACEGGDLPELQKTPMPLRIARE